MTGQRYGRLVVVSRHGTKIGNQDATWNVRCDCGTTKVLARSPLKSGAVRSCGCLHREIAATVCARNGKKNYIHGSRRSPLYKLWWSMIQRCEYPSAQNYRYYGGRGIRVCGEWRKSYTEFLAYMGRRPSQSHSVDRINNDGNYEPGNVRWATPKEQAANRRPMAKRRR